MALRKHLELKLVRPDFILRRLAGRSNFDADSFNRPVTAATLDQLRATSVSAQKTFPDRSMAAVYGLMPRSGTNFVFEMLLRMPGVERAGIGFDELPILMRPDAFDRIPAMIREYHPPSADAFAPLSWLAFAASGLRNHLLELAAPDTVTLIKEPHPNNIGLFPAIFPHDRLIVVLRDGRYVVDSFVRSFARGRFSRSFVEICEEYRAAAETVADFIEHDPERTMVVRYEDANQQRAQTIEALLTWLGHPVDRQSLAALDDLPIYGSSVRSVAKDGAVDWTPVKADASFDPSKRALDWTARQQADFERIAGAANRRLGYG